MHLTLNCSECGTRLDYQHKQEDREYVYYDVKPCKICAKEKEEIIDNLENRLENVKNHLSEKDLDLFADGSS